MTINMYKVTVGYQEWHYTSGEFDVATGLDNYLAVPMKREDLSFDLNQTELTLTIPADLEPFTMFKYAAPLLPFTLEVLSYPSMNIIFVGNVLNVGFDGATNVAKVKVGSNKALEGTTCPSRTFGVTCSYELFGEACGLNSDDYKLVVAVGNITYDNRTISAAALSVHGDNYYSGGYLQTSTGETQYIISHTGDTLELLGGISTYPDAISVDFYVGCDKQHTTCVNKFNNIRRYGGFPTIPIINPYLEPI